MPSTASAADAYMTYPTKVTNEPSAMAPYAAVFDDEGTVFWSRSADTRVPMASTTKIMTTIVVLEHRNLDDMVTVSDNAAGQEPTVIGLYAGEQISIRDLLYGLMLVSGNDAAVALAEEVGGSVEGFADMMNAKAAELGMDNTHFVTPNGLHDENHYTTVNDYIKLTLYAMQNPDFRTIVKTTTYTSTDAAGVVNTFNTSNELLSNTSAFASSPTALTDILGIKTGFTDEAGYCLVTGDTENGRTMYAIAFGEQESWERFQDGATLLEWGFSHYKNVELITARTVIGTYACKAWPDKTVDLAVGQTTNATVCDCGGDVTCDVEIYEKSGDVKASESVGTISWYQDGAQIASADLYPAEDVPAPSLSDNIGFWFQSLTSGCSGGNTTVKPSSSIDINAVLTVRQS